MLISILLVLLVVLSVVGIFQQRRIITQGRKIMSKSDDILSAENATLTSLATLADELTTLIAAGKEDPAKLDEAATKAASIRDAVAALVTQAAPPAPPTT